jgi:hypothetical protein
MSSYKFTQSQFARLADEKYGDPATYMEISQRQAIGIDPADDNIVYVDPSKLAQAFCDVLARYAKRNNIPLVMGAVVAPPASSAPARQEDSLDKMQRERREALAAEEQDADKCVQEWLAAGLLQSEYNDDLMNRWHEANPQVGWTRNNINAMIYGLMGQLQWATWSKYAPGAKAPEPVVVEATPEPAGLPYTRKQLIEKLRDMTGEQRYAFFQRWPLEVVNARLAGTDGFEQTAEGAA